MELVEKTSKHPHTPKDEKVVHLRKPAVEFIKPNPKLLSVTCLGIEVPYLTARIEGDKVFLILDGRMEITCTREEADKYVYVMAQAIAVAHGEGQHGPPSICPDCGEPM